MLDRRRVLAMLAASAASVPALSRAARAAAEMLGPRAVVALLYALHSGRAGGGQPLWEDPVQREELFTPALLAAFEADAERRRANPDEAPALNGDPFYDAQDWGLSGLSIGEPEAVETDVSEVRVEFQIFGDPRRLVYRLVWTGDGWRIDDIVYGEEAGGGHSLRGLLGG